MLRRFSLVTFFLSHQKESYPPAGRDRRSAGTTKKAPNKEGSAIAPSRMARPAVT